MTPAAVEALLDRLFTNAYGEVADCLVLTAKDGRQLAAWNREAMRKEIHRAWTKAVDTPGYVKADWIKMERSLIEAAREIEGEKPK